jgi:Arc/MetJ-type ribon-helix-helix transcriptional regulator
MRTITLRIPEPLATRLLAAVRKRGRTQSAAVREALQAHLHPSWASGAGSGLDLVRDLAEASRLRPVTRSKSRDVAVPPSLRRRSRREL